MAADIAEVAPAAWFFNYSNPVTSIITALRRRYPQVRSVGLCTCASIPRNPHYMDEWAGVPAEELVIPAPMGGLNHCSFMLDVRLKDGRSAIPLMVKNAKLPVVRWGLENYGVAPYCWSHVTEFFPAMSQLMQPYQGKLQGLEMLYGLHVHDMEHERSRSKHWEEVVDGLVNGKGEPVSLNVLPGAEAIEVVQIIEALMNNGRAGHGDALHGVNIPNQGAIPNLPDEAIVEVTSLASGYGIQPVHVGPLPEPLAATLRSHITTQQLTAEAGLTGDRKTALHAFLQDPMCQARLSMEGIVRLMDELFAAHRAHLPQFA